MTSGSAEVVFIWVCLALLMMSGAWLLAWMSLTQPRVGLYALLALTPTQFIFVPVGGFFFISPADCLALAAGGGLLVRLAQRNRSARAAVRLHLALGLMLAIYVIGFVVLDHFSRTLVRVVFAILPSILACELLTSRRHFALAASAIITAGVVDAGYGVFFLAIGESLHATRFSGMMGVNFSAMVILTAAAMASTLVARTRKPMKLLPAGVLTLLGLATLSRMGFLALAVAWMLIIWRLMIPANRRLVVTLALLVVGISLSHESIRQHIIDRTQPEAQVDGISRTSSDVRALIFDSAWDALGDQPVIGIGYFNFEHYSRNNPEIHASTGGFGYATHNTYVEVLVEGGVLAFAAFLLHLLAYARGLGLVWQAIVRDHDVLVGGILAALVVVLVSAALANVLLHYQFWAVCGVALACTRSVTREHDRLTATAD